MVSHIRDEVKEGTARDAFKLWEAGAAIVVKRTSDKVTLVEIGIKQGADRVPEQKTAEIVDQQSKGGWGKFVSFKDGTLIISVR